MMSAVHGCFVDVIQGVVPTKERIDKIAKVLPDDIKNLAEERGWNDNEVKDKLYRWVRENVTEVSGRVCIEGSDIMILDEEYLRKRVVAIKEHKVANEQSHYYQLVAIKVLEDLADMLRDGKIRTK